jgi:hypothetical protein
MKLKYYLPILLFLFFPVSTLPIQLVDHIAEGKQYETLTFHFEKNLGFENPFDLETNHVELHILTPDFSRLSLSFFYNGVNDNNIEKWEARFAPKQVGKYHFSLIISEKAEENFDVEVKANEEKHQGGLKLSKHPGVFEYENGEVFRGIGINVCWASDYEYYFKKMQAAGMNMTRIWLCPWHLSFEWTETGLGRYNLKSADRLDKILNLAQKYGIYIILCIDYHGVARKGMGYFGENRWPENPYNISNGGPCAKPEDIFTNYEARQYFKKKYKYIVSRYGHSSNIVAWEFYNEVDLMAGKSIPVNRWHIEMAEYVKSIDVHNRFVSTSSTRSFPEKVVDAFKSPAIDFVMFHQYNNLNIGPYVTDLTEAMLEYYQKPVVLAEFGVEYRGGDRTYKLDPQHIGLHNGIWSGWFNETPIIPLSWWWDNYIDKYDIWSEYKNLSQFVAAMDFSKDNLVYKTLIAGEEETNGSERIPATVRCVYYGDYAALWFKNEFFQWSRMNEGEVLSQVDSFRQVIPSLVQGSYTIKWYDPQTGKYVQNEDKAEVKEDGILKLVVPPFLKDLACLLIRED